MSLWWFSTEPILNCRFYFFIVALFFFVYFYIYPADLQESDGGANPQGGQLPRPASGDAKILLSDRNLIEI